MMSNFFNIAKKNFKNACAESNVTDFWSIYFCRFFASIFVTMIRKTKIIPNHLTYASLFIHIIGILFFIRSNFIIAAVLLSMGQILDAADGQLALIKGMKTIYGSYLDLIIDALKDLISFSVFLWFSGDKLSGIFVGIWVPSILTLSIAIRQRRNDDKNLGNG